MNNITKHTWSKKDHIIALYLYRFGMESLGDPIKLLEIFEIPLSSMTMKFANLISAIYGEEVGKFRCSEIDKEVVEQYLDMPQEKLRKEIFDIVYSKIG